MPRRLGTQKKVIVIEIELMVESSVWIRLMSRCVDDVLEMADKEERESEQMRKERQCE